MLVKIGEFECTECWDGVFYKNLQIILSLQNGKSKLCISGVCEKISVKTE